MSFFSQLINLNDTFGAFLIGAFVSSILVGGACVQAFYYFANYKDAPLIRVTVLALVILEIAHVSVTIHAVYHYLVINYNNPLSLLESVWSINILFGIIGIVVLIVHLSYAFRIYHVSGRQKLIPTFIVIVALGHFSTGWILVASLFRLTFLPDIVGFPETMGKAILASAAAIDTTIALTLSYYLHKKRTGFQETDRMINRLIKYSINNGALTSAMDLVALALVITRPTDFLFFSFTLILASLYSNSLMATLNSRRKGTEDQEVTSGSAYPTLPMQVLNISSTGQSSYSGSRAGYDPEIQKIAQGSYRYNWPNQ